MAAINLPRREGARGSHLAVPSPDAFAVRAGEAGERELVLGALDPIDIAEWLAVVDHEAGLRAPSGAHIPARNVPFLANAGVPEAFSQYTAWTEPGAAPRFGVRFGEDQGALSTGEAPLLEALLRVWLGARLELLAQPGITADPSGLPLANLLEVLPAGAWMTLRLHQRPGYDILVVSGPDGEPRLRAIGSPRAGWRADWAW